MGTNRLHCLVLKIVAQIGEFLSEPIKQMECLVPCDKRKLPIVNPYQRKQKLPEADLGVSDAILGMPYLCCMVVAIFTPSFTKADMPRAGQKLFLARSATNLISAICMAFRRTLFINR